ncbi:hypothetical protein CO613_03555 [Lysobacteraceae bacterium NML07-0707]|nr:hypothetical protein CO613_03555 [Xanthomonadaceae bacterium NML07-0707]
MTYMSGKLTSWISKWWSGRVKRQQVKSLLESGLFDLDSYSRHYPGEKFSLQDAVEHYFLLAPEQRFVPCEEFDSEYYVTSNADVSKSGWDPFAHYCCIGWREGRNPSVNFDSKWYSSSYSVAGKDPLRHYFSEGLKSGFFRNESEKLSFEIIRDSGLFDEAFYVKLMPDAADYPGGALRHYLRVGEYEGVSPSELFDSVFYLKQYPDIVPGNALSHYCLFGWKEGRLPSKDFDPVWYQKNYMAGQQGNPLSHYKAAGSNQHFLSKFDKDRRVLMGSGVFDPDYYLDKYPDIGGNDPVAHYLQHGWKEDRQPSAGFDAAWYRENYMVDMGENPIFHYVNVGRAAGYAQSQIESDKNEILNSGLFDSEYYIENYPDVAGVDPVEHFIRYGENEKRNPNRFFDTAFYVEQNRDELLPDESPLLHFAKKGWKELKNPSKNFDLWWYWSSYLDPACNEINPLNHYLSVGQSDGLLPTPPLKKPYGEGVSYGVGKKPKRICFFAGYDKGGIVDEYVLKYLEELSRFADIYYFADCDISNEELLKLQPWVKGAWAKPHGGYDFGSYAKLLKRIGWSKVEEYDELLLINDSCYLLGSLDPVFAKMDGQTLDWWGMQATKGLYMTKDKLVNRFKDPIPMAAVKEQLIGGFEFDYPYDFMVGSYFLSFRKNVIADDRFRRVLSSAGNDEEKLVLIRKYEVGITRNLLSWGYGFATYMDHLYPLHPVYGASYFKMLEDGFPLLKRNLFAINHYRVPGLHAWETRVKSAFPEADTRMIQSNLERVVDADLLDKNLHVGELFAADDDMESFINAEFMSNEEFAVTDRDVPKHSDWWGFPVCGFTGNFSGNERAVFEEVKNDPLIKKVVFYLEKDVGVDGVNVERVPLRSAAGQQFMMRCSNIFIRHSPSRNIGYPVAPDLHNIINLWHGIPFKRIGYASEDMKGNLGAISLEHAACRAVISSSKIDMMAMASSFYPMSYNDIWNTGLPRNDFIMRDASWLPEDMKEELERLAGLKDGKKLILFMPTFRNRQELGGYYIFSAEELAWIADWLAQNDLLLGIREHMADRARSYSSQFSGMPGVVSLCEEDWPNVEMLYRQSDALITDYSSCFIDYMLTGKPALSFAYDYTSYIEMERGSYYDLEMVFPGRVCYDFASLKAALLELFKEDSGESALQLEWKKRLFFDYKDDLSSARVVRRVKDTFGINRVATGWIGGMVG